MIQNFRMKSVCDMWNFVQAGRQKGDFSYAIKKICMWIVVFQSDWSLFKQQNLAIHFRTFHFQWITMLLRIVCTNAKRLLKAGNFNTQHIYTNFWKLFAFFSLLAKSVLCLILFDGVKSRRNLDKEKILTIHKQEMRNGSHVASQFNR